jgi:hypothetical protein
MRAMGSSDRQDDAIGTKARRPRVGVTRAQYQTQDFEATGGNLTPTGRIVVNVPTTMRTMPTWTSGFTTPMWIWVDGQFSHVRLPTLLGRTSTTALLRGMDAWVGD